MYTDLLVKGFLPQMMEMEPPCFIHIIKKGSNSLDAYFGDSNSFMLKESNQNFPYSNMCLAIPFSGALETFQTLEQVFTSREFPVAPISSNAARAYSLIKHTIEEGSKFSSRLWAQFAKSALEEVVKGLRAIDAKAATFTLEGFSCTVKGISEDAHEFEYEFATRDLELELNSNLQVFIVSTSSLAFLLSLNLVDDNVLLELGYCIDLGPKVAVVRNLGKDTSMAAIVYEEPK